MIDREVISVLLLICFISVLQVSVGVPTQQSVFTFVPSVWKLPIESIITEEVKSAAGSTNKVQQQHILQNHIITLLFIVTVFMTSHSTKCM